MSSKLAGSAAAAGLRSVVMLRAEATVVGHILETQVNLARLKVQNARLVAYRADHSAMFDHLVGNVDELEFCAPNVRLDANHFAAFRERARQISRLFLPATTRYWCRSTLDF